MSDMGFTPATLAEQLPKRARPGPGCVFIRQRSAFLSDPTSFHGHKECGKSAPKWQKWMEERGNLPGLGEIFAFRALLIFRQVRSQMQPAWPDSRSSGCQQTKIMFLPG
jgi:hypothetical protein